MRRPIFRGDSSSSRANSIQRPRPRRRQRTSYSGVQSPPSLSNNNNLKITHEMRALQTTSWNPQYGCGQRNRNVGIRRIYLCAAQSHTVCVCVCVVCMRECISCLKLLLFCFALLWCDNDDRSRRQIGNPFLFRSNNCSQGISVCPMS